MTIRLYINNNFIQTHEDLVDVLFRNKEPIKIEYRFDSSDIEEIIDKLPLVARTNDYWIDGRASYVVTNSYSEGTSSHSLAFVNNCCKIRRLIKQDGLVKIEGV